MTAFFLLATALAASPVSYASPSNQQEVLSVNELVGRKSPENDDWQTEKMNSDASAQLNELAEVLTQWNKGGMDGKVSSFFLPQNSVTDLRPVEKADSFQIGQIRVFRNRRLSNAAEAGPFSPALEALKDLISPYGAEADFHIHFKTLRIVAPQGTDRAFQTVMFYENSGHGEGGLVEQHATWDIQWEYADTGTKPRIRSLAVTEFSETHSGNYQFEEKTGAVFTSSSKALDQLKQGADFWHNRTDTLGGVNFLGHNGIAVSDVNNDGLDDVYVAESAGFPNLLLIQNEDGTVAEQASEAGVDFLDDTKGVLIVDVNNDGHADLCLAVGARVLILTNDGKGRFQIIGALRPPDESDFYSLSAADYDNDGDLDLYATRYVIGRYGVTIPLPWHDANNGPSNHLFQNDGTGRFTDVTRQAGLDEKNRRFSLAASWVDYDEDGDLDLYVANDFGRNNLYRNDKGRFVDVAAEAGVEDQAAGMGVSWADFDLDGKIDLHVGNMFSSAGNRIAYQRRFMSDQSDTTREQFTRHAWGNSLYRNLGDGEFADVSGKAGIRMGRWSWGARFVDINGDGLQDIISPNGFITNTEKDDL